MDQAKILDRITELESGAMSLQQQTEQLLTMASALKKELSGGSESSTLSPSQKREILEKRRSRITSKY